MSEEENAGRTSNPCGMDIIMLVIIALFAVAAVVDCWL